MKAILRIFGIITALFALEVLVCSGQTFTAASCNQSDVNAVINGPTHVAVDGDTIVIPAGTCTWASTLSVTKGITITGQGTPNTGAGTVGAGTSTTHLIDNASAPFISFTGLALGQTAKVELINMAPVAGAGANSIISPITFSGTCTGSGCANVRVDNITFAANQWETPMSGGFVLVGNVFGVIDHNTATESHVSSPTLAQITYSAWQGVGNFGDNSFATADTFGTGQEMYMENNLLSGVRVSENDVAPPGTASSGGARYVCRFNTVTDMSGTGICSAHGTAWGGRFRGQRQVEAYYNNVTIGSAGCDAITGLNSGAGIYLSNSVSASGGGCNKFLGLDIARFIMTSTPWNSCDGTQPWDQSPFSSSTQCLDQPGRGVGALLQNSTPVLASAPGTPCTSPGQCWPNPALDPVYEAGDVMTAGGLGSPVVVASDGSQTRVLANRDYYAEVSQSAQSSATSPFNGTVGTGYGTLANRPTTCTTGVGYWATDQGSWSSTSQKGVLYKCSSTNVWSIYYTPYTYPHPLTSGGTNFSLTITSTNGSVSGTNCSSGTYASGTSIGACSATPNTGYTFTGWSGTGSCSGVSGTGTASCTLTSSSTLTATFTINTFTWTRTIVGSGTLTGTNNASGTYNFGSTIGPLLATPGTGFSFSGWSGIGGSAACSGTTNPCPAFTLTSNSTATATFTVNSYTLSTATAGTGSGTITGCAGAHNFNASYSCTVTASAGSVLASVTGCSGSGTTTYAGNMPASNCTVTATFNLNSFALTVSTSGAGSGTVSGTNCSSGTYTSGTVVGPCTATPTSGAFSGWTGTGSASTCTGTGTCTFTITAASTLDAAFSTTQTPTPTFSPVAGTYSTPQTVTILDSLGTANVQITTNEGSNANASNGDVPSRNLYTNCATSCSAGVPQPPNSGIVSHGQLWCNSSQVTSCGTFGSGFVTSSISGTGTHALDNGKGAGGDDSATGMTATYGGFTANPCASAMGGATGWPGLSFPSAVPNSAALYSITTGASTFNTSLLAPSKNTMTATLSDAIDHYLTSSCMDINNTTAAGVHAEFDTNHTLSTHDYFGFGKHFNFSTNKLYFCPQGCSSWKEMDLKEADGTLHTTFSWPVNHKMYIVTIDHRDPGCTSSSGSNCMWYDYACIQDVTAGTAKICGNLIDPLTGTAPGGIPVLKSSFTGNEVNTQQQIDINAASTTITQNVWRTFVGYNLSGTSIYYTNDGSTPTTASTPYVLPISVATTQTIKAIATSSGHTTSAVGTAAYVISPFVTLSVNSSGTGSGTITGTNCATNTYPSGTAVTCNASASTGSTFTGWSGGSCTGTGSCSFTLSSNSVVTANFSLNTYTFGVSTAGTGSGTTSGTNCTNGTKSFGTAISCSASASTGSTFSGWSGTGSASSCSGTGGCAFTLAANTTATATFAINTFALTLNTTGAGSGSISGTNCSAGSKNFGTAVNCTASPSTGSVFTGWSGTGSASTCSGTGACAFTMTSTTSVSANFITAHSLTAGTSGTGSGSLSGTNCVTGTYNDSTTISCTASPAAGSAFTGWTGTGSASTCTGTGSCTFSLTADSTIIAGFNAVTFTFAVSTTGTGTGTVSGSNCSNGTYATGTSISCSATPTGGSTFSGWTGTGSASGCTGGTSSCPITLASNSTLSAAFIIPAAAPTYSPVGGLYSSTQTITISTTTGGSTICYTIDGSTPTATSGTCTHGTTYSSAVTVSTTQTIKAIASQSGYLNSTVSSATYTIVGPNPPSELFGDITLVNLSIQ